MKRALGLLLLAPALCGSAAAQEVKGSSLRLTKTAPTAFTFQASPHVTNFPVPTIAPVNTGIIALDIRPTGQPAERPGAGFAWIDVCNKDFTITANNQAVCGRVGARSDGIEMSSRSVGGAAPLPLLLGFNGDTTIKIEQKTARFMKPPVLPTYAPPNATSQCNANSEGGMMWDKTNKRAIVCDGQSWRPLN